MMLPNAGLVGLMALDQIVCNFVPQGSMSKIDIEPTSFVNYGQTTLPKKTLTQQMTAIWVDIGFGVC